MKLKYKILFVVFLLVNIITESKAQQTLFIDKQEYSCATAFYIAVRTKNLHNVVALQGTVKWDTTVVKYNSISFGSSAIAFNATNVNVSQASNGYLTFLWVESNLQGQSTVDSTSLFSIDFITNETGKGKGLVRFDNMPTSLEIDTVDTNGFPVVNQAAVFTDGYVITPSTYNFIGSGNWDIASNWKNNIIPPALLPACSEIIIDPSAANECILNVQQIISTGARLSIAAGKKFRVPANIQIQ